jgi:hypothetical protein
VPPPARTLLGVAVVATLSLLLPGEAGAATADLFEKGRRYCARTHPNHGTLPGFGPAIDINGKPDDYLWPVYAPGQGRVTIYSSGGGFGNSVVWTSANGLERIHIAHLASFGRRGRVRAGAVIGRVGSTGNSTGPHVHAAASVEGGPAAFVLHGQVIRPGRCYTSSGPIPPQCRGRDATVLGGARRDRLVGTPVDDVFVAEGGRDLVNGRSGDDAICGGPGADSLLGAQGRDELSGEASSDAVRSGPGRDLLAGGEGSDDLGAGPGSDRLVDNLGEDLLAGGAGRDALRGGLGEDALRGDEGRDRLEGGEAGDELGGGLGSDALIGGIGEDSAVFASSTNGVIADLALGTASGEGRDRLVGLEGLVGSPGDDTLTGDGADNAIYGQGGDDALDGLGGQNRLDGGPGADSCRNAAIRQRCEA